MPPIGGREDYAALFHEAGHAEHYGCTDAEPRLRVPPPRRQLGHRVVRLPARGADGEPGSGSRRSLGAEGAEAAIEHARAARLVFLRRYSAKIAYEVELARARCRSRPRCRSATRACSASGSGSTGRGRRWLSDVDSGFYVACYLRAWALEVDWRTGAAGALRCGVVREPRGGRVAARLVGARSGAGRGPAARRERRAGAIDFDNLAAELVARIGLPRTLRKKPREEVQGGIKRDSGIRDQVQKAIDELRAAGEKATGDVRSGIDGRVAAAGRLGRGELEGVGSGLELARHPGQRDRRTCARSSPSWRFARRPRPRRSTRSPRRSRSAARQVGSQRIR